MACGHRLVLPLNADPRERLAPQPLRCQRQRRNSHAALGRIIALDYRTALRQIAAVLGQGYQPGTVERGLFDMMATRVRFPPTPGN